MLLRCGGKQIPDALDRTATLADQATDVALAHGEKVSGLLPVLPMGDHHLIGVFDELLHHVAQELVHGNQSGCGTRGLPGLGDEALHRLGGTSSDAEPILGALEVDLVVVTGLLRVVVTDELDELAVTRAALVGHRDAVERMVAGAFAAESDCYCHGSRVGKELFGARPGIPPEAKRDIIFFIFPVFLASFFI